MTEGLKTYLGATLPEALAALKADLGREATILQTRKVKKGGLLGLFGREMVEIVARTPEPRAMAPREAPAEIPVSADPDTRRREDRLLAEIAQIKSLAHDLVRHSQEHHLSRLSEGFFAWYRKLVELGVGEQAAQELVIGLSSEWRGKSDPTRDELLEPLIQRFLGAIRMNGRVQLRDGKQTRIVLVGPPGSGKSTTIAKLASQFALQEGIPVGLVTLDTHRVGAEEQITAYARMLNVPLVVAKEPLELEAKLADLGTRRLLLVDTQGLPLSERTGFDRTVELLRAIDGAEVHLVLSATATLSSQEAAIRNFRPMRPRNLIVTKLDESVTGWSILELVRKFGGGLSYVSFGQNVPEDLVPAEPEVIGRVLRAIGGLDAP